MSADPVIIRVLLVDDHDGLRGLLKQHLNERFDVQVVGDTGDGAEAVELARQVTATVALVDISMRDPDGLTVTRDLARACPILKVVAFTRHSDATFVRRMFEAGAVGYVLKQSAASELLKAIRVVASGEQYVDPAIRYKSAPTPPQPTTADVQPVAELLDDRESQVLRLITGARSNPEIAESLRVSVDEVRAIRVRAMAKVGLKTRGQVIDYCQAAGWLPAD